MGAITAVYWDVGGVLLTNGWDHHERERVLARFGLDKDAYEARHPDANDAWERGQLTIDEFLQRTVFYEPRSFSPEQFLQAMREESRWLPGGALRILQALAASHEVKLGMLNNEARELNDYRIDRFGLHAYFGGFFSSCYLNLRKPDPRIFEVGLALMHQQPEATAFIDDRAGNCAAAQQVGMRAIQYTGDEEKLAADLRQLGVRVDLRAVEQDTVEAT